MPRRRSGNAGLPPRQARSAGRWASKAYSRPETAKDCYALEVFGPKDDPSEDPVVLPPRALLGTWQQGWLRGRFELEPPRNADKKQLDRLELLLEASIVGCQEAGAPMSAALAELIFRVEGEYRRYSRLRAVLRRHADWFGWQARHFTSDLAAIAQLAMVSPYEVGLVVKRIRAGQSRPESLLAATRPLLQTELFAFPTPFDALGGDIRAIAWQLYETPAQGRNKTQSARRRFRALNLLVRVAPPPIEFLDPILDHLEHDPWIDALPLFDRQQAARLISTLVRSTLKAAEAASPETTTGELSLPFRRVALLAAHSKDSRGSVANFLREFIAHGMPNLTDLLNPSMHAWETSFASLPAELAAIIEQGVGAPAGFKPPTRNILSERLQALTASASASMLVEVMRQHPSPNTTSFCMGTLFHCFARCRDIVPQLRCAIEIGRPRGPMPSLAAKALESLIGVQGYHVSGDSRLVLRRAPFEDWLTELRDRSLVNIAQGWNPRKGPELLAEFVQCLAEEMLARGESAPGGDVTRADWRPPLNPYWAYDKFWDWLRSRRKSEERYLAMLKRVAAES